MACFTAEHVIPLGLATARRTCQVGDNIWVIQDAGADDYEIWKIDTKTKRREKVEYTNKNPMDFQEEFNLFGDRNFIVSTSSDKIYMWRNKHSAHGGSRFLEFNTSTLELKNLFDVQQGLSEINLRDTEFHVCGSLIFTITKGRLPWKVIKIETRGLSYSYAFPDEERRVALLHNYTCNICELNGSMYSVRAAFPATKAVYRFDTEKRRFMLFSKKVDASWEKSSFPMNFDNVHCSVWAKHNHIYQSFNCNNEKVVIDRFDVQTEQWSTIFYHEFETPLLSIHDTDCFGNICLNDKYAYVISDHHMELVIQEFDLDPNLEAISLYTSAVAEAAKIDDCKPSSIESFELPEPLRRPFANILAWKTRQTELGQLEYHLNFIAKLEDEKEHIAVKANGDQSMRSKFATAFYSWDRINKEQHNQELKFEQLRKKFEKELERQINKVELSDGEQWLDRILRFRKTGGKRRVYNEVQLDALSSKLKELVQRYQTDLQPRMAISRNYESLIEKYRRES